MAIDLTGGLPDAREYAFEEQPDTPDMRDASNMWIWDDQGRVGLPRIAVEVVAPDWSMPQYQVAAALPGGRIAAEWSSGPLHPVFGPDGKASVMGAGPIEFVCLEPFRRYRASFDGEVADTDFETQARGQAPTGRVKLRYEVECEMATPPWVQGEMSHEAAGVLAGGEIADFMGGDRFEQLFRARGWVEIGGERYPLDGGGVRIRRQGVRKTTGFWGHCWQTALFPSGKAFGYIAYPPNPSGGDNYNEGYVFLGDGELIPATAVKSPWLRDFQYAGEDVGLVLETAQGRIEIAGETLMSRPHYSDVEANSPVFVPPLNQSIVRYRWDGEEACGMLERSNLAERVTPYA